MIEPALVCEKKDILARNIDSSMCEWIWVSTLAIKESGETYTLVGSDSTVESVQLSSGLQDIYAEGQLCLVGALSNPGHNSPRCTGRPRR